MFGGQWLIIWGEVEATPTPVTVVTGCIVASGVYQSGGKSGQSYQSGSKATASYRGGLKAGQTYRGGPKTAEVYQGGLITGQAGC